MSSSPSSSISTVSPTTLTFTSNDLNLFTKLFLLFIFLSLFLRVCYVYISMCRDQQGNENTLTHHGDHSDDNHNQNHSTGLSINVINSYHTFTYGSKTNTLETIYDHDTTCSICIEDYEDSEMLRMIPQCRHYFHRDCVDAWLKVNTSCPICRNSLGEVSNNGDTSLDYI